MIRGRGPPPSVGASPAQPQFPHCVNDALNMVQKHLKATAAARGRPQSAGKSAELQNMIDHQIFCMVDKRSSRLSEIQQLHLLNMLADYFLSKQDDAHKFSYLETIFLGRENDRLLHNYRIRVLFRLAAFALQYPMLGIFNLITQWLSKPGMSTAYGKELIDVMVEFFVDPPNSTSCLHTYLIGVECVSADFSVLFLSYAPRPSHMGEAMMTVISTYIQRNIPFILNSFRDTPELSRVFCKESFPVLLDFALKKDGAESKNFGYHTALLNIVSGWKDKNNLPDTSLLLQISPPLSPFALDLVGLRSSLSGDLAAQLQKHTQHIVAPRS